MVFIWSLAITAKPLYNGAIIGCGRIGSMLEQDPLREKPCTHAGAFAQHNRTCLIAGCDIKPERLSLFQQNWKAKNTFQLYHDLLKNEKIDILCIATEIARHHEIVIEAAKYNIPVIICEKPIGISLLKANDMIQQCEQHGSLLMINHERRFASDYVFVKQLINNGEIGEIRSIRGNILTGSPKKDSHYKEEGGGPLLHDGTHLIDIIRFITDSDIEWVFAEMKTTPSIQVEDSILAMLHLKNDISCLIEAGGRRQYFSFDLEIYGSLGKIIIGNGVHKWYKPKKSRYYSGFNDLVELPFPDFNRQPQFLNQIDAVVDYLDNGNKPKSLAEDGYKALETIFALYQSAIKAKKIYLPLIINDENPLKEIFY